MHVRVACASPFSNTAYPAFPASFHRWIFHVPSAMRRKCSLWRAERPSMSKFVCSLSPLNPMAFAGPDLASCNTRNTATSCVRHPADDAGRVVDGQVGGVRVVTC